MAVEIKYVVIREGEEKMSFASKKEADAYDKMLDLAEVLNDWLVECPLTLDEEQRDSMAMWLVPNVKTPSTIFCAPVSCRKPRAPPRRQPIAQKQKRATRPTTSSNLKLRRRRSRAKRKRPELRCRHQRFWRQAPALPGATFAHL